MLTGQDFLAKKHFFFNLNKEKRLNSSTVKMSSSFEQKPNFTHHNSIIDYFELVQKGKQKLQNRLFLLLK